MAKITALTEAISFKPEIEVIKDEDLFVTWDWEGDRPMFHSLVDKESGETQNLSIVAPPSDPLEAGQARAIGINIEDLYQRGMVMRYDPVKRQVQDRIVGRPVTRVSDEALKGFDASHPAVISTNSLASQPDITVGGAIKGASPVDAPGSLSGARQVTPDGRPLGGDSAIVPATLDLQSSAPNLLDAPTAKLPATATASVASGLTNAPIGLTAA